MHFFDYFGVKDAPDYYLHLPFGLIKISCGLAAECNSGFQIGNLFVNIVILLWIYSILSLIPNKRKTNLSAP